MNRVKRPLIDGYDIIPFGLVVGDDLYHLLDLDIITGVKEDSVTPISIDVRLHDRILVEQGIDKYITRLHNKNTMDERILSQHSYTEIKPSGFILAGLDELVNLPNDLTAVFHLRSSLARLGVNHSISIHMMPGWRGRLTLEITNSSQYNHIELYNQMDIGTIMFYKHKPTRGYSGKYQDQTEISC